MTKKETNTKIELGKFKLKDEMLPFIKKMTLDCVTYPEIEIRQFDMMPCTDEDEDRVEVHLGLNVEIKKSDFFKLVQIASDKPNTELAYDWSDRCPCTVTLETRPTEQFLQHVTSMEEWREMLAEIKKKNKEHKHKKDEEQPKIEPEFCD